MACEEYQKRISADLDGELRADEEIGLWEHLRDCADCCSWRRDQILIRAEFHRWPLEALPAKIAEPAPSRTRSRAHAYRVPRPLAWAAGILIVLQSTLSITSMLSRPVETADEPLDTNGYVETITLTPADRTSFTVHSSRVPADNNKPQRNGG